MMIPPMTGEEKAWNKNPVISQLTFPPLPARSAHLTSHCDKGGHSTSRVFRGSYKVKRLRDLSFDDGVDGHISQ